MREQGHLIVYPRNVEREETDSTMETVSVSINEALEEWSTDTEVSPAGNGETIRYFMNTGDILLHDHTQTGHGGKHRMEHFLRGKCASVQWRVHWVWVSGPIFLSLCKNWHKRDRIYNNKSRCKTLVALIKCVNIVLSTTTRKLQLQTSLKKENSLRLRKTLSWTSDSPMISKARRSFRNSSEERMYGFLSTN